MSKHASSPSSSFKRIEAATRAAGGKLPEYRAANARFRSAMETFVPTKRIDPVVLGMVLGLVNTIVIAAGMNAMEHAPGIAVAGNVFAYGFLPATFVGAMLGAHADRTRDWPIWARRVVLTTPALVLVILLAGLFQFPDYALLSFVPTLAAALYLEQRTREPVLPAARTLMPAARAR